MTIYKKCDHDVYDMQYDIAFVVILLVCFKSTCFAERAERKEMKDCGPCYCPSEKKTRAAREHLITSAASVWSSHVGSDL